MTIDLQLTRGWGVAAALSLGSGCLPALEVDPAAHIACASAADCPSPLVCVEDVGRCAAASAQCIEQRGERWVSSADGTGCGATGDTGICVAALCGTSRCGDGFVDATADPAEQCDDGPDNSDREPGACRPDCLREHPLDLADAARHRRPSRTPDSSRTAPSRRPSTASTASAAT